jgi:hypothetical protein
MIRAGGSDPGSRGGATNAARKSNKFPHLRVFLALTILPVSASTKA